MAARHASSDRLRQVSRSTKHWSGEREGIGVAQDDGDGRWQSALQGSPDRRPHDGRGDGEGARGLGDRMVVAHWGELRREFGRSRPPASVRGQREIILRHASAVGRVALPEGLKPRRVGACEWRLWRGSRRGDSRDPQPVKVEMGRWPDRHRRLQGDGQAPGRSRNDRAKTGIILSTALCAAGMVDGAHHVAGADQRQREPGHDASRLADEACGKGIPAASVVGDEASGSGPATLESRIFRRPRCNERSFASEAAGYQT